MTGATAAGEAFPMIEDGEEEVAVTDGGGDERDVGKSWKLRVKETLRAFSSNYLHFVQEEQRREEAVKQLLKRQGQGASNMQGGSEVIAEAVGLLMLAMSTTTTDLCASQVIAKQFENPALSCYPKWNS